MNARVDQLVDAVAGALVGAWGPTAPDGVSTEYAPDIGLTPDQADTLIQGRQVFVWPAAYGAPELLDRAELLKRYTVVVVVVERYTETTKRPPNDWIRARTAFVERQVYNLLRDPGLVLLDSLVPAPEEPGTVDVVYDLDVLIEHRAFWSQASFTFQETSGYGG